MDNAFLFDENSTGICSEEDYPYAGHKHWFKGCIHKKGECDGVEHTRVKTFIDVKNTEKALMKALVKQPVSVAIEADQRTFQMYKEGVYDDPACGNRLDHGVAAGKFVFVAIACSIRFRRCSFYVTSLSHFSLYIVFNA